MHHIFGAGGPPESISAARLAIDLKGIDQHKTLSFSSAAIVSVSSRFPPSLPSSFPPALLSTTTQLQLIPSSSIITVPFCCPTLSACLARCNPCYEPRNRLQVQTLNDIITHPGVLPSVSYLATQLHASVLSRLLQRDGPVRVGKVTR